MLWPGNGPTPWLRPMSSVTGFGLSWPTTRADDPQRSVARRCLRSSRTPDPLQAAPSAPPPSPFSVSTAPWPCRTFTPSCITTATSSTATRPPRCSQTPWATRRRRAGQFGSGGVSTKSTGRAAARPSEVSRPWSTRGSRATSPVGGSTRASRIRRRTPHTARNGPQTPTLAKQPDGRPVWLLRDRSCGSGARSAPRRPQPSEVQGPRGAPDRRSGLWGGHRVSMR